VLPHSPRKPPEPAHPHDEATASQPFYLTFANDSQQITLRFDVYGDVTNGFLSARPTCVWQAAFLAVSCRDPQAPQ
jgi:hypothetical protein